MREPSRCEKEFTNFYKYLCSVKVYIVLDDVAYIDTLKEKRG